MADKFERIVEYRVLLTKQQELRIPLTTDEAGRLDRLRRQFPDTVPALDERDPYSIISEPIAADVVYAGSFNTALVRNATGGGLALAMHEPPPLGQRLLIHVRDQRYAFQYTIPGWVVSRVVKGVSGISIAFEGLPTRTPIGTHRSGVYRAEDDTPTRVGRHRAGSGR